MTSAPSPVPRRRLDPNKTYLINHDLTFSEVGGPQVAQAAPQPAPQPVMVALPPAPKPDPKAEAAAIKASWKAAAKSAFIEMVPEKALVTARRDEEGDDAAAGWRRAIAKANRQLGL